MSIKGYLFGLYSVNPEISQFTSWNIKVFWQIGLLKMIQQITDLYQALLDPPISTSSHTPQKNGSLSVSFSFFGLTKKKWKVEMIKNGPDVNMRHLKIGCKPFILYF